MVVQQRGSGWRPAGRQLGLNRALPLTGVIFCGCCNNLPQTRLKTIQIYHFTVLEVGNPKSSHWAKIKISAGLHAFLEAPGENLFSRLYQCRGAA